MRGHWFLMGGDWCLIDGQLLHDFLWSRILLCPSWIHLEHICVLFFFVSGSDDGAVKIWHDLALLREILLDSSLSAACFLNNRGDLVLGYQKHLFYIDHTKGDFSFISGNYVIEKKRLENKYKNYKHVETYIQKYCA